VNFHTQQQDDWRGYQGSVRFYQIVGVQTEDPAITTTQLREGAQLDPNLRYRPGTLSSMRETRECSGTAADPGSCDVSGFIQEESAIGDGTVTYISAARSNSSGTLNLNGPNTTVVLAYGPGDDVKHTKLQVNKKILEYMIHVFQPE
jgi:hypothetical protein